MDELITNTNMATAVHTVFDIVELAETIFLNLSFREIFVIQRVSTRWKTIIKDSITLQRKMLLHQLNPELRHGVCRCGRLLNPLLHCPVPLDLGPFILDCSYVVVERGADAVCLINMYADDITAMGDKAKSLGVIKWAGKKFDRRQSWGKMTTTMVPMRVEVMVRVKISLTASEEMSRKHVQRRGDRPLRRISFGRLPLPTVQGPTERTYIERIDLGNGDVTLESFLDSLEKIKNRTRNDHLTKLGVPVGRRVCRISVAAFCVLFVMLQVFMVFGIVMVVDGHKRAQARQLNVTFAREKIV